MVLMRTPAGLASIGDKSAREGILTLFTLSATDEDPTNDTLTYHSNDTLANLNLNPATGEVTFTPDYNDVGTHDILFSVTDGNGGQDNETITITVESLLTFGNLIVTIDGTGYPANNGDTVGPASPDSAVSFSIDLTNNYETQPEWVSLPLCSSSIGAPSHFFSNGKVMVKAEP